MAGSLTIVLHAPEERPITSLLQVWHLALQPGQLSALSHVHRTLTLITAVQCTAVYISNTYVPDHICFSPVCCTLGSHLVKLLFTICFGCAGFLLYVVSAIAVTLVFMLHIAPAHGTTSIYVYITICSLVGSLSVMSCKVHPHSMPFPHLHHIVCLQVPLPPRSNSLDTHLRVCVDCAIWMACAKLTGCSRCSLLQDL